MELKEFISGELDTVASLLFVIACVPYLRNQKYENVVVPYRSDAFARRVVDLDPVAVVLVNDRFGSWRLRYAEPVGCHEWL
tara:strand:- start:284 stop:526 length:243 start_codon:yes stop_codon:yes gene_type:complete